MKKLYFIFAALSFFVFSCKNRLTEKPQSFITADQYYITQNDAISAVTAAYFLLNSGGNAVQTPYNTLFSTGMDMMTDDINPGPGATNQDVRSQAQFLQNSSGLRILQLWQQHYAGIYKANLAIEKVPQTAATPALKTRLVAEAKFLRALYYFNLVRLYGGVPKMVHANTDDLSSEALNIPRSSSAEIYELIETDLLEAAADLPSGTGATVSIPGITVTPATPYASSDIGRATNGAAIGLLAKVYLTQENWQKAADYAKLVINGGFGYSLLPDYSQVFLPSNKTDQLKEHLFAAQFKSNSQGQGNNQAPRGARKGTPGIASGSYADQIVFYSVPDTSKPGGVDKFYSVYKMYKKKDQRRNRGTFATRFLGSDGKYYGDLQSYNDIHTGKPQTTDSVPYLNKWWDPSVAYASLAESGANVPILRYSDVLLIYAEALNELGQTADAYAPLNEVRRRALTFYDANAPYELTPGLDQAAFRDSVYLDRRLEFVWENARWFDLIRQKDANGQHTMVAKMHLVGKTNAAEKHYLYPIPLQEIQLNPSLTQNPGW
jgi:hypothetical protein